MSNNPDHQLSSYDYNLPKELIAQEPAGKRDQSRLLVLNRTTGSIEHKRFSDIVDFVTPGDCLIINKTKVIPARLYGKRDTGGRVEVLFLNVSEEKVRALVKPYLGPGKKIFFPGGLECTIESKTPIGEVLLSLQGPALRDILDEYGEMPLPPYIKRSKSGDVPLKDEDRKRYQTVYSKEDGSIAAPTAGLHFTPELLNSIKSKGVDVVEIILHVGWGTFKPVRDEDITKHQMLPEYYQISGDDAKKISECMKSGRKIFAVGTTTVRAIESVFSADAGLTVSGETSMFIYPGYDFKVTGAFITNFHLPHSTPLFMASAFAGRKKILDAYQQAIEKNYRFYSYGDAMLIL